MYNSNSFTFISCGKKDMMYTLRVATTTNVVIGGVTRSIPVDYYICNLSTDAAKAEAKALTISSEMDLPFRGSADFDLEEIRRRKASLVAEEREAAERIQKEREEAAVAEFEGWVNDGIILLGKYQGVPVADVATKDLPYVRWLASNLTATGKLGASAKIAHTWLSANGKLETNFVGTVGETITVAGTFVRAKVCNGQFFTIMYTVLDQDDNTLVFYSTAKCWKELQVGDTVVFTGLVKEHRKGWDNINQTIINKPKLVKQ